MARADFIAQLKVMGFEIQDHGDGRISIPFPILVGSKRGTQCRIGFIGCDDFPANPPGTLHVTPCLLPKNSSGGNHPYASVHDSPFGPDWQYWSRPLSHWAGTKKTARDVIAHIQHLLDTL